MSLETREGILERGGSFDRDVLGGGPVVRSRREVKGSRKSQARKLMSGWEDGRERSQGRPALFNFLGPTDTQEGSSLPDGNENPKMVARLTAGIS